MIIAEIIFVNANVYFQGVCLKPGDTKPVLFL